MQTQNSRTTPTHAGQENNANPALLEKPLEAVRFCKVSYTYTPEDSPFAPLMLQEQDSWTHSSHPKILTHDAIASNKRKPALRTIDLSIEQGSFVCIIGNNGSGKSTLAQHINALKIPHEGLVLTLGLNTSNESSVQTIRSRASMIFQNPDNQIVASLVEDEVAFGPRNLNLSPEEIEQRTKHALELVGLQGFEKRHTHDLSGGQKQRLAIAGALAMNPEILILDEASSMLDPCGRADLMKIVRQLHASGITIIMLTHCMEETLYANTVIILESGTIAYQGSPWDLFSNQTLCARFDIEPPLLCTLALALDCFTPGISSERELLDSIASKLNTSHAQVAQDAEKPDNSLHDVIKQDKTCTLTQHEKSFAETRSQPEVSPLLSCKQVYFSYDKTLAKRALKLQAKQKRLRTNNALPLAPCDIAAALKDAPQDTWALQDVSFDVFAGEFIGLAGHTGSGKSTLIQHCNALLTPSLGQLFFKGQALTTKRERVLMREKVGLAFQYPEHQLFAPSILEDVMFGPLNQGLRFDQAQERAFWALELVGLGPQEWKEVSPFSLSGGQQRLVALAGIIALKPELLILDEPTSSLDAHMAHRVLELIARLNRDEGMGVILVSHNMDELSQYCSRILFMHEGELVAEYPTQRAFDDPCLLHKLGLDLPSHKSLAKQLIYRGVALNLDTINSQEELICRCKTLQTGRNIPAATEVQTPSRQSCYEDTRGHTQKTR